MIGILTEKPSAGRNFAKALGGPSGSFNGEQYKIVSARGHLYEFVMPAEMVDTDKAARYKSWDISNLPWDSKDLSWKREKIKGTSDCIKTLKTELSGCDEIVIATDVDPSGEGELLAYEILEELKFHKKRITRMYFIDESEKEIKKAFTSRKPISDFYGNPDYKKAYYRSRFDYLTMQFTRIAKTCGDNSSIPRQGRLKSAMVRIVGEQLEKVANYKKVPFYCNKFRDENNNVYSSPNSKQYPDKSQVPDDFKPSAVIIDSKEQKSSAPAKLLDLASLSAKLAPMGYKAKAVTDCYQKMYEAQIVSYPRTEDKFISPEQFNELLPLVDKIADVVGVDRSLLTHRTPRNTHVKTGGAHGANRPGPKVPSSLDDLKQYGVCGPAIYSILAKSYLAMLAEDYIYDQEKGFVKDYPDYKATVNIPVSQGWKAVFNPDDDEDSEEEQNKHLGTNALPFVYEGFPPKPTAPTMKWLMAQLAKHDVGTGATRTSTYADVTNEKTEYPLLIDKKGKISMAPCGEISYKLLPDTHIGSLELTLEVQDDMKAIAEGKLDPDKCLEKVSGYVIDDIKTMTKNGSDITKKAGKSMAERYSGTWNGQEISFKKSWSGHDFTDEECEQLCNGDTIEIDAVSSKSGKEFKCRGKLEEQEYNGKTYVGFKFVEYVNDKKDDVERFHGTWNGREVNVKKVYSGHEFTDDEIKKLLAGETIVLELKSKEGKAYKINGKLSELEYNGRKYIGFERLGFVDDEKKQREFPSGWCKHYFTPEEIQKLKAGQEVYREDWVGKSGKKFKAGVTWDKPSNQIKADFK